MTMSRYAIFRYQLLDGRENALALDQHIVEFESVRGEKAPYRVRDAEAHDYKNFIFDVVAGAAGGTQYFSIGVGYQITERIEHRMNPETEKISLVSIPADDMRATRAVFVPALSVAAFRDGSGDTLPATGGAGRVSAIFDIYYDGALEFEMTAQQRDVSAAMRNLKLIEMRFDVRPFNPHPKNPGLRLHELLKIADVGKLTATAKPFAGGRMKADDGGLVSEAQGMSDRGYGHFGIKAETKDGATVSYKKSPLVGDKEKDQTDPDSPKQLYVSVDKGGEDEPEEAKIVNALVEIYSEPE